MSEQTIAESISDLTQQIAMGALKEPGKIRRHANYRIMGTIACGLVTFGWNRFATNMIRRTLTVVLALVLSITVSAQEQSSKQFTISQLLKMDGRVVSANNDYVWISVENSESEGPTLYVCFYDVARPDLTSRCAPIT